MTNLPRWLQSHSRIDLHMHSHNSDGRLSPEALLENCAFAGLDCISITDHDLEPSIKAGRNLVGKKVIHVIHGAEISGRYEDRELHLLVYFPEEMPETFRAFCRSRAKARADRYNHACKQLGISSIPNADEKAQAGLRSLTRMHLAQHLVQQGITQTTHEAFQKYLGHSQGLFPLIDLSFLSAIDIARSCGGITSWAHPSWDLAEKWTPNFASAGLHALEAIRPSIKKKSRKRFERLATRHGLFLTGGSDWHGWKKDPIGSFSINGDQSMDFLSALYAA